MIPLGVTFTTIIFLAGGVWWMSALYSRVASAEQDISTLENSHKETVLELKEMNTTLTEIKTLLKRR